MSSGAYRPELKNHSRSWMIGPPSTPSYDSWRALGCVMLCDTSNGFSFDQLALVKFVRKLPENELPPLLVIALMTPPLKRPYSAEMPEVSTCVSSIASS